MKKIFFSVVSFIIILSLVFCLSSCSVESGSTPENSTQATSGVPEAETTEQAATVSSEEEKIAQAKEMYNGVITGYPQFRAEILDGWGYGYTQQNPIKYGYAIKDLNSDGIYELIIYDVLAIADDDGNIEYSEERLGALYTLDGNEPVLLENFTRHGSFWINTDGYVIYSYKWCNVSKIVGTELEDVIELDKDVFSFDGEEPWDEYDDYLEEVFEENGISREEMDFDFTYLTGSADVASETAQY